MLDVKKPAQTRDGRKARIICVDANMTFRGCKQPIIALVTQPNGEEDPFSFCADGAYYPRETQHTDLVNAPETL